MKSLFYLMVGISLMTSCSHVNEILEESKDATKERIEVDLTNDEFLSISENDIPEFTAEKAVELLNTYVGVSDNQKRGKRYFNSPVFKITKRIKSRMDENSQYYLASVKEKSNKEGFALVYGNKLFPQVACYIPIGSINDTIENEGLRIMYNISKESVEGALVRYNSLNKDSLKSSAYKKISRTLKRSEEYIRENLSLYDISIKKSETKAAMLIRQETFPLLNTEWHQGGPYNLLYPTTTCSNFNNNKYEGRHPAGCVMIALAQSIVYTKPNVNNWDYNLMERTSQVTNSPTTTIENQQVAAVSNFIVYLRDNVVSKYEYTPNCQGTGASTDDTVKQLSKVKMKADGAQNLRFDNIYSSIVSFRVIWIRGENSTGGHSWLLDAYMRIPNNWPLLTSTYYNDYVHCNFGNGAAGNGFFQTNNNSTSNLVYTNNVKIYTNVRKI